MAQDSDIDMGQVEDGRGAQEDRAKQMNYFVELNVMLADGSSQPHEFTVASLADIHGQMAKLIPTKWANLALNILPRPSDVG